MRNRYLSPWFPVIVVALAQCGFGVTGMLRLLATHPSPVSVVVCLVSFAAVLLLQLVHCAEPTRRHRARYGRWTLSLQAFFTFAPVVLFGAAWGGMGGFVAGSTLLIVDAPLSWILFALYPVVAGALAMAKGFPMLDISCLTVGTAMTGLMIYGLLCLAELLSEAHRNQGESAHLAVTRERLRFSRDLHDLLGYSLASITLKSELVHRMVEDNEQARKELGEVLDISRQALSDVRTVAYSYRELSLCDEVAAVRRVLAAAGVEADIEAEEGRWGCQTETALATVLREGVTNLLRHAEPSRCRIRLREEGDHVRLTLSNDGVRDSGPRMVVGGRGLDNLAERMARLGGALTAEVDEHGWFHVIAGCPLVAPQRTVTTSPPPRQSVLRQADFAR
ncbi:sensor histidine kinase [Streptomyces sp. NPDC001796]|uniref:sensor histidine kinase n=1 Tax=Streptomyces sp. NPDC001796 TaxID=3364609 RepID=UPI00368F984C